MKKLWLISMEVLADSIEEAAKHKNGRVYSVVEASKEYQPEGKTNIGFKKDGQKTTG